MRSIARRARRTEEEIAVRLAPAVAAAIWMTPCFAQPAQAAGSTSSDAAQPQTSRYFPPFFCSAGHNGHGDPLPLGGSFQSLKMWITGPGAPKWTSPVRRIREA